MNILMNQPISSKTNRPSDYHFAWRLMDLNPIIFQGGRKYHPQNGF
jgi:hypothetical protein